MNRAYYSDDLADFLAKPSDTILGQLARCAGADGWAVEKTQTDAWLAQINILKNALAPYRDEGAVYFEFAIPRLGGRIDVLVLIRSVILVIEFKVGEDEFTAAAFAQAADYALDLKNFHETSHSLPIAPIVVPTKATSASPTIGYTAHGDNVMVPIEATLESLPEVIRCVLEFTRGLMIDRVAWESGRYHPTPTIIEAAKALYGGHKVEEI
jgi:hypothetical protein